MPSPPPRPRSAEDVTGDLAHVLVTRLAEVRSVGGEGVPLLLDDPFRDLDRSVKPLLLELLGRSAGEPQIVFLTEDEDVASWARLEALTGEVALIEPAPEHDEVRLADEADPALARRRATGRLPPMELRLATLDDAEPIRQIYNLEVTTSTATFDLVPRSLEDQRAWQSERSGARAVLVAELDGEVCGFGSLSPWRDRPAYATTVEDSVYVHRDHQGQGVGAALLTELVATATAHGFHACMARIVGGHDASIALHQRCGFEVVGTEREVGRKFGKWLDVVLMERLLT